MYAVIIEWDGKIPPRTFHNRMHSLGLFVRGSKDLPPLKRRAIQDGSVVAQEGCILCASYTLARQVAAMAEEEGAKEVSMGTVDVQPIVMDTQDVAIMNRVEEICGKRGRPTGERLDWVVTCYEEMNTYAVRDTHAVVNCPYCSGLQVFARPGSITDYAFPQNGTVLDAWLRHRFSNNGRFEHPQSTSTTLPEPPAAVPAIYDRREASAVDIMRNSAEFLSQIERLPRYSAAAILDAILRSRVYAPQLIRREARVKAFIYLVEKGIDPSRISLAENDRYVDILDASELLSPTTAAQLWMAVN